MPILISAHNDTSTGLDYLGSKVKAYPPALPSLFRYFRAAVDNLVIDLIAIVVVAVCIGLGILLRDPKMMRRHPK